MQPIIMDETQRSTIYLAVDKEQVLKRISLAYFGLGVKNAQNVFDGLFGPQPERLSTKIQEALGTDYSFEVIDAPDLSEKELKKAVALFRMDKWSEATSQSLNERIGEQLARVRSQGLFLYESQLMDPQAHDPAYQTKFPFKVTYRGTHEPEKGIFKYCYPVLTSAMRADCKPFSERKFCCMIASNKIPEWYPGISNTLALRRQFVEMYKNEENFSLFGPGWPTEWPATRGLAGNKLDTMNEYLLVFSPENTGDVPDYITEKIFHGFQSGNIVIYLGPPNINTYIPKECYIDLRDFLTVDGSLDTEKLNQKLNSIDEAQYNEYMAHIRKFLGSDQAKKFCPEAFVSIFAQALLKAAREAILSYAPKDLAFDISNLQR